LAESSGAALPLAQVHNLLGVLARADQQPNLALAHLSKSLEIAHQLENPSVQIAALNNLALAQADLDDYSLAISTLQDALETCLKLGDRHLEAALRNNLADTLRADGQEESAMVELKQAVAIFADIGQNVEDLEPEIWKLTEW
jgi:tetratricopeptide (TPR) repeat protein